MVRFLNLLDERLASMDAKLDKLQETVTAMSEGLQRMLWRPVLEELADYRKKVIKQHSGLRSKVYIPADGVKVSE